MGAKKTHKCARMLMYIVETVHTGDSRPELKGRSLLIRMEPICS